MDPVLVSFDWPSWIDESIPTSPPSSHVEFLISTFLQDDPPQSTPCSQTSSKGHGGSSPSFPLSGYRSFNDLILSSQASSEDTSCFDNPSTERPHEDLTETCWIRQTFFWSSRRISAIHNVFRTSQGSRFGKLKQNLGFLLLTNTPHQANIEKMITYRTLHDLLGDPPVYKALCNCHYRRKMSQWLGWESNKSTNILAAAYAFGPAVVYCVPEKRFLVQQLKRYRVERIDPYTNKVILQDKLYHCLAAIMDRDHMTIEADQLVSFMIKMSTTAQSLSISINAAATLHDLLVKVAKKTGYSMPENYTFEMPDGILVCSPKFYQTFRCAHRFRSDLVSICSFTFFKSSTMKFLSCSHDRGESLIMTLRLDTVKSLPLIAD